LGKTEVVVRSGAAPSGRTGEKSFSLASVRKKKAMKSIQKRGEERARFRKDERRRPQTREEKHETLGEFRSRGIRKREQHKRKKRRQTESGTQKGSDKRIDRFSVLARDC